MSNYKFKPGDKVVAIKTEFTAEEWNNIGPIETYFEKSDVLEVQIAIKNANQDGVSFIQNPHHYFPTCGFKLYSDIPIIKDYSFIIDKLDKLNIR